MAEQFQEKESNPELVESSSQENDLPVEINDLNSIDKDSSADTELVGKTIGGHYEVQSKIGTGGMSNVYRAHHKHLDKIVALKTILPKFVHDDGAKLRFKQEAKAASSLEHPNICSVREYGLTESGQAYLVMDHLEGESLADLLKDRGQLSVTETCQIMADICKGLAFAHSKSVIHRDIKPANILLVDSEGELSTKISDFGIAKLLRDDQSGPNLTQTGEIFGTPNYMSPEQCRGSQIDARSDIYSLGCMFYELLTGNPPFVSESVLDIFWNHLNDEADLDKTQIPRELKAILYKSLRKKPEERYQSVDELLDDLKLYLAGQNPNSIQLYKQRDRSKFMIIASVCLLFVIVISGIAFSVNMYNSKPAATSSSPQTEVRTLIIQSEDDIVNSRLDSAKSRLDKASAIAKSVNDEDLNRSLTMKVLKAVSHYYKSVGDYKRKDDAERQYRALVQGAVSSTLDNPDIVKFKKLPTADSVSKALDRAQLLKRRGSEYISYGDFKSAETVTKEALALQEKWLGDSAAVANTLNQLGYIEVTQGKLAEAEKLWIRARSIAESKMSKTDPNLIMIWANNARMLHHKGQSKKADELYNQAVNTAKEKIGIGSASHIYALESYTEFLNGTKNIEKAKKLKAKIEKLKGS